MLSQTNLSVVSYKDSTEVTADRLVAHLSTLNFDVATIAEYTYGVAAQNFHITLTDGQEFLVRCDARRSIAAAAEDRLFSVLMRRNGLAAPRGPWSFSTVDGITVIVRPHLSGNALPDLPPKSWPDGRHLGNILARIHRVAVPLTTRNFFYASTYSDLKEKLEDFTRASKVLHDIPIMEKLVKIILTRVNGMVQSLDLMKASPFTFIHGDYTPTNILSDGGKLYIIDWEKSCIGPSYSDLAQALYYFCAATPQFSTTFASSLLSGYDEVSSFSSASLRAWIKYHPVIIFIFDTISAAKNRELSPINVSTKRERYFHEISLPRFKKFLEFEKKLLAVID